MNPILYIIVNILKIVLFVLVLLKLKRKEKVSMWLLALVVLMSLTAFISME